MSEEEMLFILNNTNNKAFKLNIKESLNKKNNWSNEIKVRLEERFKNTPDFEISFEEAIKKLDTIFKGRQANISDCFECIKALIRHNLQDLNEEVNIYFGMYKECNGIAYDDSNSICLNIRTIIKLINCKDFESNPEALHIIDTLFHESQHLRQNQRMKDKDMSDDSYEQYKEELLRAINNRYYDKNYYGVTYEQDARVVGAQKTYELLEKYFPYMTNCIEYYKKLAQEEKEKKFADKEIFELSDKITINEAIEKLVLVCPSIINKHQELKREYTEDGIKKSLIGETIK